MLSFLPYHSALLDRELTGFLLWHGGPVLRMNGKTIRRGELLAREIDRLLREGVLITLTPAFLVGTARKLTAVDPSLAFRLKAVATVPYSSSVLCVHSVLTQATGEHVSDPRQWCDYRDLPTPSGTDLDAQVELLRLLAEDILATTHPAWVTRAMDRASADLDVLATSGYRDSSFLAADHAMRIWDMMCQSDPQGREDYRADGTVIEAERHTARALSADLRLSRPPKLSPGKALAILPENEGLDGSEKHTTLLLSVSWMDGEVYARVKNCPPLKHPFSFMAAPFLMKARIAVDKPAWMLRSQHPG